MCCLEADGCLLCSIPDLEHKLSRKINIYPVIHGTRLNDRRLALTFIALRVHVTSCAGSLIGYQHDIKTPIAESTM